MLIDSENYIYLVIISILIFGKMNSKFKLLSEEYLDNFLQNIGNLKIIGFDSESWNSTVKGLKKQIA